MKKWFTRLAHITRHIIIFRHRCRNVLITCCCLAVLLPVTADATQRISLLPPGKAAAGVTFGADGALVVIEKNLDNSSRDEDLRIQSQTAYSEQVLVEALTLQWTQFSISHDYGYWASGGIAGGYDIEYNDPLDNVIGLVSIGLYKPLGALKPHISAIYNYNYDTHFNEGSGLFAVGIGVEIDFSDRLSVNIKGEGFTRGTDTHFTITVMYHSWD